MVSPVASGGPHELADWIEFKALSSPDGNASFQDLVAELRRNGSTDALPGDMRTLTDAGGETTEALVDDGFAEITDRVVASGRGYPFKVDGQHLQLNPRIDVQNSTYIFLLFVSMYGPKIGATAQLFPDRDFEDISIGAARQFLCAASERESYLLAFPRRTSEKSFPAAVNKLSVLLGEGGGINKLYLNEGMNRKDAALDLVVWRGFPDHGPGQLIAFGHCASGKNWKQKAYELPEVEYWCMTWMRDPPSVLPLRMFFIPHRPPRNEWKIPPLRGQVLFDRCRIAYHVPTIPDAVSAQCAEWILNHPKLPKSLVAKAPRAV